MEESSTDSESMIIETLGSRGWCFGEIELVKAIIMIHSALADDPSMVVDAVESELLNTDLKSIGAKSLPDPALLRNRKSSHILGPKVLQISSVRDITKSSIEGLSQSSSSRRLLKLGLTDGHSEITAIEYVHIPSIPDGVVPGTKVRLEDKAVIRSGIVCLNPKVLTLLGGLVQPLYEEWQMNQKYSGFSRSSLRLSQESDTGGPPPFEKLQIKASSHRFALQGGRSDCAASTSKNGGLNALGGNTNIRPTGLQQNLDKASDMDNNPKTVSITEKTEEKASSSEMRPKEVVESVPVQNQAAAQKLLQKMSNPNQEDRHSRGRKHRGKGREDEPVVFTLDEWENRKAGTKPLVKDGFPDISRDEDLAWQLQNQFDLEDSHAQKGPPNSVYFQPVQTQRGPPNSVYVQPVQTQRGPPNAVYFQPVQAQRGPPSAVYFQPVQAQRGPPNAGADDLRMSMFNYARDDERYRDTEQGGRGRGRGRGKGRRGQGRGRGRGWG